MATILVVEDNRTILENTSELLEMEGYSVITATNGKEGYSKVLKFLPDLIVSDIWMPEMDGFELLKTLGTHADLKNIPLIFLALEVKKRILKKVLTWGPMTLL